jgi:ubiquinone/menaquinone biosynthesis C-methylase UbiE
MAMVNGVMRMTKLSAILTTVMCTVLAIHLTVAHETSSDTPYHEFPRQELTIEDFPATGYILDIGGGGEGVIGQMKPDQVVAIDINEQELIDAPGDPLKIVMDATDLKFLDNSFDTATCFFTLMYMNEQSQEQTFREVHRVLAPNGRFLVWDVYITRPEITEKRIAVFPFSFTLPHGKVINTGYGVRWPVNTHDLDYYKKLAKKAGFRVVREKSWSRSFFLELESTARD